MHDAAHAQHKCGVRHGAPHLPSFSCTAAFRACAIDAHASRCLAIPSVRRCRQTDRTSRWRQRRPCRQPRAECVREYPLINGVRGRQRLEPHTAKQPRRHSNQDGIVPHTACLRQALLLRHERLRCSDARLMVLPRLREPPLPRTPQSVRCSVHPVAPRTVACARGQTGRHMSLRWSKNAAAWHLKQSIVV